MTELLVESDAAGLRAALVAARRLEALEIDQTVSPTRVGLVAHAKVVRTLHGLGTIVRLPDGTDLLLDGGREARSESGGSLSVQVTRDPRGDKMGRASRKVALTGRALIHLPFDSGIGASRRLVADEAQRKTLDARLSNREGGWILRRTALDFADSDIEAEISGLSAEGARLCEAESALPPPDAFRRLVSDCATPDRILCSGRSAERSVRAWCETFAPSLLARLERHAAPPTLFDLHDLDGVIESLAESRVALPGGGSLVIERTEALTAIDVNAGAESNVLTVNLAAAAEIARQLRLRHVGGIVVVDFISMARPRDRDRTVAAIKAALADDPAQTHVLPMSAFGLVEMTRERRGPELKIWPGLEVGK